MASINRLLGDSDLGSLRITLYRGSQFLTAAGHEPNVFVTFELGNNMLRSQTKWQNPNPIWGSEVFDFVVTDLAAVLDITVHHENGVYEADQWILDTEFLGARRISIDSLRHMNGACAWIVLKDIDLVDDLKSAIFVKVEISCGSVKKNVAGKKKRGKRRRRSRRRSRVSRERKTERRETVWFGLFRFFSVPSLLSFPLPFLSCLSLSCLSFCLAFRLLTNDIATDCGTVQCRCATNRKPLSAPVPVIIRKILAL